MQLELLVQLVQLVQHLELLLVQHEHRLRRLTVAI